MGTKFTCKNAALSVLGVWHVVGAFLPCTPLAVYPPGTSPLRFKAGASWRVPSRENRYAKRRFDGGDWVEDDFSKPGNSRGRDGRSLSENDPTPRGWLDDDDDDDGSDWLGEEYYEDQLERWERWGRCEVLPPPEDPNMPLPLGVVHLIGGAVVGLTPRLSYDGLSQLLAARGFLVVATPLLVSRGGLFDHWGLAEQCAEDFATCWPTVVERYGPAAASSFRLFGLGHSLGAKLHLLVCSDPELNKIASPVPRAANVLVAYNNFAASQSVPWLKELRGVVKAVKEGVREAQAEPFDYGEWPGTGKSAEAAQPVGRGDSGARPQQRGSPSRTDPDASSEEAQLVVFDPEIVDDLPNDEFSSEPDGRYDGGDDIYGMFESGSEAFRNNPYGPRKVVAKVRPILGGLAAVIRGAADGAVQAARQSDVPIITKGARLVDDALDEVDGMEPIEIFGAAASKVSKTVAGALSVEFNPSPDEFEEIVENGYQVKVPNILRQVFLPKHLTAAFR